MTRSESLAYGNELRTARAKLRREIRELPADEGRAMVADLIDNCPRVILGMQVAKLVGSIHRVGDGQVTRYLIVLGVKTPAKKVGELTDRQRQVLVDLLLREVQSAAA